MRISFSILALSASWEKHSQLQLIQKSAVFRPLYFSQTLQDLRGEKIPPNHASPTCVLTVSSAPDGSLDGVFNWNQLSMVEDIKELSRGIQAWEPISDQKQAPFYSYVPGGFLI